MLGFCFSAYVVLGRWHLACSSGPWLSFNRSSSQDARAQNWPSVNQGVPSDTMADEPEDPHVNRDELFHIVRDADYVDAKKALAKADMAWRHTALQQNFLFFIAARRRRGSELLARQASKWESILRKSMCMGRRLCFGPQRAAIWS